MGPILRFAFTRPWPLWLCVAALALTGPGCLPSSSSSKGSKDNGGGAVIGGVSGGTLDAFQVTLEDFFPGVTFINPMVLLQAPSDPTHWYVFERMGQVWRIDAADMDNPEDFGTVPGIDTGGSEGGLLGAAFHPDFPATQDLFLSYTIAGSGGGNPLDSIISRVDVSGGSLDMGSEDVLIQVDKPQANHNGGDIAFGPDGYLYISLGDGGGGGDNHGMIGNGQDRTALLGKILRIDVDTGSPYGIPAGNPFVGDGGGVREEIFAYGFRNPWRFSFDSIEGDLWVGDVGQANYEEVNIVLKGRNYGWRVMEGTHCFNPSSGCNKSGKTLPVLEYSHNNGDCSVTGGFVYRGTAHSEFQDFYFYSDYCTGRIYAYNPETGAKGIAGGEGSGVAGFGQGLDGEIYVLNLNTDRIYHMVPAP